MCPEHYRSTRFNCRWTQPTAMLDDTRCELCDRPTDGVVCRRCGTVVCRMHFDGQLRFCAECAERAKPTGRRGDTFLL